MPKKQYMIRVLTSTLRCLQESRDQLIGETKRSPSSGQSSSAIQIKLLWYTLSKKWKNPYLTLQTYFLYFPEGEATIPSWTEPAEKEVSKLNHFSESKVENEKAVLNFCFRTQPD